MNNTRFFRMDRMPLSGIPLKAILVTLAATLAMVFVANRTREIGERIPFVLVTVWAGSATIAALIFSSRSNAFVEEETPRSKVWTNKLRLACLSLAPLVFVPLLELRNSGYDPALWLMNGILVVSLCSVPYFWMLARSVLGTVVLSMFFLSMLWNFAAWGLFTIIIRMEAAKAVSTVDTTRTLHAFLAPEYRVFFYSLCAAALLVYCPLMMRLGYRRFLADQTNVQMSPRLV